MSGNDKAPPKGGGFDSDRMVPGPTREVVFDKAPPKGALEREAALDLLDETPGFGGRLDKAPPKGALEEAVSLYDDLRSVIYSMCVHEAELERWQEELDSLELRRAALEPRLAKRRENQAKPRGDKP